MLSLALPLRTTVRTCSAARGVESAWIPSLPVDHRLVAFVLPHSGHWVSDPSDGWSAVSHASLSAGVSNPQFRQRVVVTSWTIPSDTGRNVI